MTAQTRPQRRIVKRVILPGLWLLIGGVIAVSLAVLAFGGGHLGRDDSVSPTADMSGASQTATVETGSISNTLTLDGDIRLDPPVAVKVPTAGTVSGLFVPNGAKVAKGAPLFEIKSAGEPAASADDEDAEAKPTWKYTTVYAPAAGRVSALTQATGDEIGPDTAIQIRRTTFTAHGSVAALDRYRLLDPPDEATVTIAGGPKPFRCTDLTIADAASATAPTDGLGGDGEGDASTSAESAVTCRVPEKVTVFDGLSMSMSIDAGGSENTLVVPVTAVRGLVDDGTVWVVADGGKPAERAVRLGVSDGKQIEVRKGLTKGEEILRYVPGSDQDPGGDQTGETVVSQ